jgi:hypothetical protein
MVDSLTKLERTLSGDPIGFEVASPTARERGADAKMHLDERYRP